jgi:hypothetical protein
VDLCALSTRETNIESTPAAVLINSSALFLRYNTIINAFKHFQETNPQLHQLGFRDKAWSVNKLAYVARKQGLGEVCVNVLNKLYGFMTMEVQVRLHTIAPSTGSHYFVK